MPLKEQKIPVRDLSAGMYVCRLDRDWDGTPFPPQGVLIRSDADIETLSKYCNEVFIDADFGPRPRPGKPEHRQSGGTLGSMEQSRTFENT